MDVLRMLNPKFGTLLTAAELGSFTRAAAALNFTQPAVSHQISQLEQQLGVTLFVRAKGKISLTPEGEIVVQYVRRMKALEQQLLDDLQPPTGGSHACASASRTRRRAISSPRCLQNSGRKTMAYR